MLVESYLFLFSLYILLSGLFVQQLTSRWLWAGCGLSLASFLFVTLGFKNLTLFDFFYGLNLGSIFVSLSLVLSLFYFVQLQQSLIRNLIFWVGLLLTIQSFQWWFIGDQTSFQTNLVETLWLNLVSGGSFYHDLKCLILVVCLFVCVGVYHRGTTYYEFDYAVMILLGGLASLLVITQENLILIYLNLEFQALLLYILTTYYRFEETNSEAGLKYLLVGSLVSGFFLVGIFFFYFFNGSLNVSELTSNHSQVWLLANFIFKLGAVPFYFWTPAVYQQLDFPSLIFISILPKLSVWFLLFKSCSLLTFDNSNLLYWSGVLSIVIGGVGGLYQLTINSVVAYSGILNVGYLLLFSDQIFSTEILFMVSLYLISYYLVLGIVLTGFSFFSSSFVTEFLNLSFIGFFCSLSVYYFFLSLGGLPVLPGFTAKIYLLGFLLERNLIETFLVIFFSLFSVVYYLRVTGFFLFYDLPLVRFQYEVNLLYYLFLICFVNSLGQTFFSFW